MPSSSDQKTAVVLCPASTSDLEDLVAIRIEAMRESLERLGRFDPNRARERFLSGFDVNCTRRIVVSGDLVGFVVIKNHQGELLLDHLYVIPGAQGLGIGSEVLTQIFREADEIGRPIKVGALKESASNRFYTRHGFVFVESGEFDNYYVRANSNAVNLGD
jgi:GNAT superfamily N-acetyltransferase